MFSVKKLASKKLLLLPLTLLSLVTGIQTITRADNSNQGLVIFSGIKRENILPYYLDFGVGPKQWERYKFRIPAKKLTAGASKFYVVYPDYYDGKFDPDRIEVRIKGKSLPLKEVIWDKEARSIEIEPEEPIIASERVELVFSNVKNPSSGTYYFHCQAMLANDIPVRVHLGTWIVDIK